MNFALKPEKIFTHENDLPDWVIKENHTAESVAVDTEAMGLCVTRDRLCLVQLSFDSRTCHLVQFSANSPYNAPNLVKLLENAAITKIFHFARFDIALLFQTFGVVTNNIYCTKIASKLSRTYTEKHGLKSVCMELLDVELSKKEQSSDWGKFELTEKQKFYAASDVLYLQPLKEKFDVMLERESRKSLAVECFKFLPYMAQLDCYGWSESIFSHL
jgi:ribonuclease D